MTKKTNLEQTRQVVENWKGPKKQTREQTRAASPLCQKKRDLGSRFLRKHVDGRIGFGAPLGDGRALGEPALVVAPVVCLRKERRGRSGEMPNPNFHVARPSVRQECRSIEKKRILLVEDGRAN